MAPPPNYRSRPFAATLLAAATALLAPAPAEAAPGCRGSHWVGAWAASPSWAAPRTLRDQSLRLIVNPTLGGRRVRVRLSNRFGAGPVRFGAASIALHTTGPGVVGATARALRFRGDRAVTVPPGEEVASDALTFPFKAFQELAVTLHVRGLTGPVSEHYFGQQISYLSEPDSGDRTADDTGSSFTREIETRPYLSDLEVSAPRSVGAVVTLGDSITDGVLSTHDANARYPDRLARRLAVAGGGRPRLAVQNAGIGSNRVLSPSGTPFGGPPALERIDEDVLDQAGVSDVIVMEGTNDLGHSFDPSELARAEAVIFGLQALIGRLHARGLNVVLGTHTPAKGLSPVGLHGSPQAIAERNRVNDWIRTSATADEVVDFHAALRDPADPDRLLPAYDSGDVLHPSDAGYRAMGDAIPLAALRGPACAHPIRLSVGPRRAAAGIRTRFVFRATVGRGKTREPLPGATIRFAGHRLRTAGGGRASLVARIRRSGRFVARAGRPGYAPAVTFTRVHRRR